MTRDLTTAQFDAAIARHGIHSTPGIRHGATFHFPGGGSKFFGAHYLKHKRRVVLADLIHRKEELERERELEAARKALQESAAAVVNLAMDAIDRPSDDMDCCGEHATGSGQHGEDCTPAEQLRYAAERCRRAQREYIRLGGSKGTKEARDRAMDEANREMNAAIAEVLGRVGSGS